MPSRISLGLKNGTQKDTDFLEKIKFARTEKKDNDTAYQFIEYDCSDTKAKDSVVSNLAEYILTHYEKKLLEQWMKNNFLEANGEDRKEMISRLHTTETEHTLKRENRKIKIEQDLSDYFCEKEKAYLDGLVLFRLKRYLAVIEDVAEFLFEQYFYQKECEEFIDLLRYFVSVQPVRESVIHLVFQKDAYFIFDEKKQDITQSCMKEFPSKEKFFHTNGEDILLSILIMLAPVCLVIHHPEFAGCSETIHTIEQVFSECKTCKGCELCGQKG